MIYLTLTSHTIGQRSLSPDVLKDTHIGIVACPQKLHAHANWQKIVYACNYLCMQFCLFGCLSTRLDIRNNVLCIFSNFLCIYKNGWSPAITAPKNLIFFWWRPKYISSTGKSKEFVLKTFRYSGHPNLQSTKFLKRLITDQIYNLQK